MSGGVNCCQFIGNLGRDAELRYTPGGTAVCTFSIACSEFYKDSDGKRQERTEWIRCVLWGKTAESLNEYLVKGKQIYVMGKMTTRSWEDKQSGEKRYMTEVKCERVHLLGSGGNGGTRRRPRDAGEDDREETGDRRNGFEDDDNRQQEQITDDDIPF